METLVEGATQHLYRHFDEWDNLLYVGVSLSTIQRLSQHKSHSHWFNNIKKITIENFSSREEALEAERIAVEKEDPLHNIALKKIDFPAPKRREANIEDSCDHLTNSIVTYKPMYTIEETSYVCRVGLSQIKNWIETKQLGYVEIGRKWDTRWNRWQIKKRITGWQILDFIENLQKQKKPEEDD